MPQDYQDYFYSEGSINMFCLIESALQLPNLVDKKRRKNKKNSYLQYSIKLLSLELRRYIVLNKKACFLRIMINTHSDFIMISE